MRNVLIEVKSTQLEDKRVFPISLAELEAAAMHFNDYLIVRVFSAPQDESSSPAVPPRLVVIRRPFELIRQQGAQLLLRF